MVGKKIYEFKLCSTNFTIANVVYKVRCTFDGEMERDDKRPVASHCADERPVASHCAGGLKRADAGNADKR